MEESSQSEKRKTVGKNGENVRRAERKERRDLVRTQRGETVCGYGERELREVSGTRGGGRWERNAFGVKGVVVLVSRRFETEEEEREEDDEERRG